MGYTQATRNTEWTGKTIFSRSKLWLVENTFTAAHQRFTSAIILLGGFYGQNRGRDRSIFSSMLSVLELPSHGVACGGTVAKSVLGRIKRLSMKYPRVPIGRK